MINEIKHLYPNADPLLDFELRDNSDGKGPYITKWNAAKLGAQPTSLQLADVKVAAVLSESRRLKWQAIKAKRYAIQYGGILVQTKWYHTDEESMSLYGTLLSMASEKALAGTVVLVAQWKTMNGTFVSMTVDLLRAIRDAGVTTTTANFTNAETHRTNMLASATPETYDFSTGWSAVYVP